MIVPTRNEARNLEVVLPAIAAVRPAVHEVIVVDGNSKDGTVETALRVLPEVRIVRQTRKGKGNAMACGFAAATGDALVMFDADGSADPQEIPRFVQALVDGADFAKGSRFTRGGGSEDITLLRKSGNAGLNLVANTLFGTRYTDLCYGYNAFWADILPQLDLPPVDLPPHPDDGMYWGDGFEIETVLNCRVAAAGFAITEVPSVEKERMFGETNLRTFADGTRVLRTLAAERRRAGREGAEAAAAAAPSAVTPPADHPIAPRPGRPVVAPPVAAGAPSPATQEWQRPAARPAPVDSPTLPGYRQQPAPHAVAGDRRGQDGAATAGAARAGAAPAAGDREGSARTEQARVRYAWGEEAS
ncbi:glycosyltransferase family 2 protein [Pseudonocardia sp. HH130630-07]|uniref:glycosyltransferase family 2 protein n=1 Tax=Pseudonocardia sp. HH130630-07 TaxID=1690815 RepID=UPI001E3A99A1|nr:glycosyltransferase family 2 protein [Pseudonocardia sp. HH130630-07]